MTDTKPPTSDHLASREEIFDASLKNDELLEDLPDVRPPHRLRVRQQNSAIALAFELDKLLEATKAPDLDSMTLEELQAIATHRKLNPPKNATVDALIALLTPVDYEALKKPELLALAASRGLEHTGKSTVEELVAMLIADDPNSPVDTEVLMPLLDFAARIDDWAEENIARDKDEYTEWAEGKSHNTFFALLTRYAAALGK